MSNIEQGISKEFEPRPPKAEAGAIVTAMKRSRMAMTRIEPGWLRVVK